MKIQVPGGEIVRIRKNSNKDGEAWKEKKKEVREMYGQRDRKRYDHSRGEN